MLGEVLRVAKETAMYTVRYTIYLTAATLVYMAAMHVVGLISPALAAGIHAAFPYIMLVVGVLMSAGVVMFMLWRSDTVAAPDAAKNVRRAAPSGRR